MTLPRYAIQAILAILFLVAAGARFSQTTERTSPYFKGTPTMNYRHAQAVANGEDISEHTHKANWPEGYRPGHYRASGVEILAGQAYRVAQYFSEVDARRFFMRLTILFFALAVFSMYSLTRNLWNCQAAGLFAAFVTAFSSPLAHATAGRNFEHLVFAAVVASFQVVLLQRHRRKGSPLAALLAAAFLFVVVWMWEYGLYYAAAVSAVLVFMPSPRPRRWAVVPGAVAAVLASLVVPYYADLRAIASWPVAVCVASAVWVFLPARYETWRWRWIVVAGGAAIITLVLTPVRAGAAESVEVLRCFWYRLRYLSDKPWDPSALPDTIRYAWPLEHAAPSAHEKLRFFLPLAVGVIAVFIRFRERITAHGWKVASSGGIALIAAVAFAVDRDAIVPANMAVVPFVALCGHNLSQRLAVRGPFVVVALYLVVAQTLFAVDTPNITLQIADRTGIAHKDPDAFLWVSMENTDRELVRFVATRTSVANPVLGSPDVTSLLLAFSGRTSVPLEGAVWDRQAQRDVDLTRRMYGAPDSLVSFCEQKEIKYVLYSIDYLLDDGRYSKRYLAGIDDVDEQCAAFRMHFAPESIPGLRLVYENDHYRLFQVTRGTEPVFITDHPPVYQIDILRRTGDLSAFGRRVVELILTYRDAMNALQTGNEIGAVSRLSWCLENAPGFTKARIGLGEALLQAGRTEQARDVLESVIKYAPDNMEAMYWAAYAWAELGDSERALQLLEILFVTTRDKQLLDRAYLLKTFIDQGLPISGEGDTSG